MSFHIRTSRLGAQYFERSLLIFLFICQQNAWSISESLLQQKNTLAIDLDTKSINQIEKDFKSGRFKQHCPELKDSTDNSTGLSCFAKFLENRSQTKAFSVVEIPTLTRIAELVALKNSNKSKQKLNANKEKAPIDKLSDAVNFLDLLAGLHSLSKVTRSLVPDLNQIHLSNSESPDSIEPLNKEQNRLKNIEEQMSKRLSIYLEEKLQSLSKASLEEIQKLPESEEKKALQVRINKFIQAR